MVHGNERRLIAAAKRRGIPVLGEVVNTHPLDYAEIDWKERVHRKLPVPEYPRQLKILQSEVAECDFLLSPSRTVTDSYVGHGFPRERVITLPFGANLTEFS